MKRTTKILIAIVIAVVAAGVILGLTSRRGKDQTPVTLAKVERADLTRKVSANGRIDAQRKVDLSANVMGQIVNLAVREGDVVKKGQFLLQIDRQQLAASASGAQSALRALFSDRDAARANLAEAQRTLERAQKNYNDKIIPQAEFEKARTAVEAARANFASLEERISQARSNVEAAQDTLSKTTMRAPMDGIVTALTVEEGEVAVIGTMNNPGTKLLTVADMGIVEAVMEVDETDIPDVKVGQRATVTIDAYPNKTYNGVVTEVGSSPIQRVGGGGAATEAINFEVKIQVENPPAGVRPGFSASADIITGTRTKTLAIPIQALVVREKPGKKPGDKAQDEEGVYVHENGAVKFVTVKTDLSGESQIEIVSGLKEGQQIVTGPFRALREIKDGTKVKEQKEPAEGEKKDGEEKRS
jgi:HlyD family secretion protein